MPKRGTRMKHRRHLPMLTVLTAAGIGTLMLGTAKPAFAADIYNSHGFESPQFATGPLLTGPLLADGTFAGQNGWIGVPPLSPNAAVVSTDQPYAGHRSIVVHGADLVHQDSICERTNG